MGEAIVSGAGTFVRDDSPGPVSLWVRVTELVVAGYAAVIVVGSIFLFVMNATSQQVSTLIDEQNVSALRLGSDLEYYRNHQRDMTPDHSLPPGLLESLVEFSRRNGQIIKGMHRLRIKNVFAQSASWSETRDHINREGGAVDGSGTKFSYYGVDPNTDTTNIVERGLYQIRLYQAIRDYAQDLSSFSKCCLGAVTTYLLPVAYALLGSFLRAFRSLAREGTIGRQQKPVYDRTSMFLMAAIAGIVISLFTSVIPKDLELPPLAFAFLVGYAIEAFTCRLDAYVSKVARN